MRIKTILFSAIGAGMLLASCGGPGEGRPVSDIKNATDIDSISNLLGQLYANDYWGQAASDSTLATPEAREAYLKGVKDALALSGKDENYIEGYILGLQFSKYAAQYEKEMGVKVDTKEVLQGLAYGLRNDSTVDVTAVNSELNRITTRYAMQKDEKDRQASLKSIADYVKGKGYNKIDDSLYGKNLRPGEGAELAMGDIVACKITFTDMKGKKIGIPMPAEVTVAEQMAKMPIGKAIMTLRKGATGEFVTTAFSIFGANADRYDVDPTAPLIMTIEIGDVSAGKPQTEVKGVVREVAAETQAATVTPARAN